MDLAPTAAEPVQRRQRRSSRPSVALSLFFEELREREELAAVVLTTADGTFLSGSGPMDLRGLGLAGAEARGTTVDWDRLGAHVRRFEHQGLTLVLTSAGRAVFGDGCLERIRHILG
jgi:hypothetical protein